MISLEQRDKEREMEKDEEKVGIRLRRYGLPAIVSKT